ncbi:MAG: hypothetical protein AAF563_03410 [Pseudomonadota bacterium]
MRCFLILWLVTLLLSISPLRAQEEEPPDGPFVRVEVDPETVSVGEAAVMRVTVLAPTWFPEPPVWPSFEIANALVMLPPDSSRSVTERIGRDNWAGVVRSYRLYPQLAGEYRITGQTLDVTYADPQTREPIFLSLDVPDIVITSAVPPGAETLDPLLIGTSLTLEEETTGITDELEAGDAVVRSVTATIDGMPAMFLPPLIAPLDDAGLSALVRQPIVEDRQNERSDAIESATRSESVSYVFETGGTFVLPAIELSWWNTETSVIETATLPETTLTVASAPGTPAAESGSTRTGLVTLWSAVVLVVLAALVVVFYLAWPRLRAWRTQRHARYLASEAYAFRCLENAARHGGLSDVDRQRQIWLARLNVRDREPIEATTGDALSRAFAERYAPGRQPEALSQEERQDLLTSLRKARAQPRSTTARSTERRLPAHLNPVS